MYKVVVFIGLLACVAAPPVVDKNKMPKEHDNKAQEENMDDADLEDLEYNRYLKEIVSVLEGHADFKKRLETEDPEYIKSGKIADHLDELIPKEHRKDVRDKLSEIKLKEIERLRELYRKKIELDGAKGIQPPEHIDHSNLNTFEAEDLKKLIKKTTADLESLDKKREAEFKEYEMKKEAERRHKISEAKTNEERLRLQKEYQAREQEHKKHPKVHHPGSKDQLEEVWEEVDDMDKDTFDPRTFFNLHDLDGNGFWDEHELNALFQKELDKVYNESDPNDDPRERIEEMERMKVHVIEQMDHNKDRMISLDEFLRDTQTDDYKKDEGWETLDQQKQVYSQEEYRRYQEEMARRQGWQMPEGGYPDYYYPQDYVGQPQPYQPGQQQIPPHPVQGQGHPQPPHPAQVPVHQGQVHPQPPHPAQVPVRVHPGQVPVQQGQVPQHQQAQPEQQGGVPPGQPHPGQVPSQHQGQPQAPPPGGQPGHAQPQGGAAPQQAGQAGSVPH